MTTKRAESEGITKRTEDIKHYLTVGVGVGCRCGRGRGFDGAVACRDVKFWTHGRSTINLCYLTTLASRRTAQGFPGWLVIGAVVRCLSV